ncbi:hypothetical protein vseg_000754 [Gypsophila vaccaria]
MSRRISDDPNKIDDIASRNSPGRNEPVRQQHGVERPEKNVLKDIGATFKETFFHDDPLRNFKGQPTSKRLLLGLQAVFPIFEWGRGYTLSKFFGDLVAGATIASLAIPQVTFLAFNFST